MAGETNIVGRRASKIATRGELAHRKSTPADDPPNWEEVCEGCKALWPELVWTYDQPSYDSDTTWIHGNTVGSKAIVRMWWRHGSEHLTVSLTPPPEAERRLWSVYVWQEVKLPKVPTLLPRLLTDGRQWWGHDTPKLGKRRAS